jgi:hypothetical protein
MQMFRAVPSCLAATTQPDGLTVLLSLCTALYLQLFNGYECGSPETVCVVLPGPPAAA